MQGVLTFLKPISFFFSVVPVSSQNNAIGGLQRQRPITKTPLLAIET